MWGATFAIWYTTERENPPRSQGERHADLGRTAAVHSA